MNPNDTPRPDPTPRWGGAFKAWNAPHESHEMTEWAPCAAPDHETHEERYCRRCRASQTRNAQTHLVISWSGGIPDACKAVEQPNDHRCYCGAPIHPAAWRRYRACSADHGDVVEAREERDEARAALAAAQADAAAAREALASLAAYWVGDGYIERGEVPPHECEFATNPEAGRCSVHEMWADAFEAIAPATQGAGSNPSNNGEAS